MWGSAKLMTRPSLRRIWPHPTNLVTSTSTAAKLKMPTAHLSGIGRSKPLIASNLIDEVALDQLRHPLDNWVRNHLRVGR